MWKKFTSGLGDVVFREAYLVYRKDRYSFHEMRTTDDVSRVGAGLSEMVLGSFAETKEPRVREPNPGYCHSELGRIGEWFFTTSRIEDGLPPTELIFRWSALGRE
jgi:hypothetical protein